MNPATRFEAARARLEKNRALLLNAKSAGPPCIACVHYIPQDKLCGHLAYTQQAFNPIDGEVSTTIQVPAHKARADDGLCGLEALLYEPPPSALQMVRDAVPVVSRYGFLAALWAASGYAFWSLAWPIVNG